MVDNTFFEEAKEQSRVKSSIVSNYFGAWAEVMEKTLIRYRNDRRLAYIDLFSGPGIYQDGTESTPLLVLRQAIASPFLSKNLITVFNDKDQSNIDSLRTALSEIENVHFLQCQPYFLCDEVGDNFINWFNTAKMPPSLVFIDPWGYKSLSLQLIRACTKGWGCDCIFFFNYRRINQYLTVDQFRDHMRLLFGEKRFECLRKKVNALGVQERESEIVGSFTEALKEKCAKFVLPFKFKEGSSDRTSHYLFLTTKHFKGYDIMKSILTKMSSTSFQGVANFEFAPIENYQMSFMDKFHRPVDKLANKLNEKYHGKKITFKKMYESDSVGTWFIAKHFRKALKILEHEGKIQVHDPGKVRRGLSYPPSSVILFREES